MQKNSTISKARSYREIGRFWDSHDLAEHWDETAPADFDVEIESEQTYYGVEKDLSDQITHVAHEKGVSPHTLVNLWLHDKIKGRRPA